MTGIVGGEARSARTPILYGLALAVAGFAAPAGAQEAPIGQAVELVESLYDEQLARLRSGGESVLRDPEAARLYFADAVADAIQATDRLGFDPIFGAQDFDVGAVDVRLDPELAVLRGTAHVNAHFENFGRPTTIQYLLRIAPPSDDWQIIDIVSEQDGWTFSDEIAPIPRSETWPPQSEETLFDRAARTGAETAVSAAPPDTAPARPARAAPDASGGTMLVLDASGSMWGRIDGEPKISIARRVIADLLETLPAERTLGLVAYGHRRDGDCSDIEVLVTPRPGSRDAVRAAVDAISPQGKTPLSAAVIRAAEELRYLEEQASVILVSDGRETCDMDPCAVGERLESAGLGFTAHVIGFDVAEPDERAQLQCLAERTGGRFLTASTADELAAALSEVSVQTAPLEPEIAPAPPAQAYFEETFEDGALGEVWSIENEQPDLYQIGHGRLLLAGLPKTGYDSAETPNRFTLEMPLPDGDYDLVLDAGFLPQTWGERSWVGLHDGADDQILASLYLYGISCPVPYLELVHLAGGERTVFETSLLSETNCLHDGGRTADLLASLVENSAQLRLSRRGRSFTAAVLFVVPASGDRPEEERRVETQAVTVLRPPARAIMQFGNAGEARGAESIYMVERFAIEEVR